MISHFFIDRPIFASVISIVVVLVGALSLYLLPIAQYPDIAPPQIVVSANYPGATADAVAQNVAAPIELQVNGADNMIYMYSTSTSTGNMNLTVFFDIGTDPDMAQVDVENRLNMALPQLPQAVTTQGVQVQKKSNAFLMVIAVYSPDNRYNEAYVANYTSLYVLDAIKRIPGANQSSIFGMPDYAMRIWLDPLRMAQMGITATQVAEAIKNQNKQYAVGQIGEPPNTKWVEQTFSVTTQGMLETPEEFEQIIIRADQQGAAIVRLKDIGRAELGMKDYSVRMSLNGKTATLFAVYQQPGANALDVAEQVKATLEELKKSFPDGIDYKVSLDTTEFVRESVFEVIMTFFEAALLVILVVFLFLQSVRATIIPILAVPVSIIGAASGMMLFGFSINMLTLFGMVLAIGMVVDDAIVVIENIERNMAEFNLSPKEAAKKAMTEVTGPVIAIMLVLCSVFLPVAFLGGMTGQLYKQFAITIAISVIFSGMMALSLTPSLAAIILKPSHGSKKGFFGWFERGIVRMTNGYGRGVSFGMRRAGLMLTLFIVLLISLPILFKITPTSFVPEEDQGYFFGLGFMPDSSSLDRTQEVMNAAGKIYNDNPAVSDVAIVSGYSVVDSAVKSNAGVLFTSLKGYSKRDKPELRIPRLMEELTAKTMHIKEGIVMGVNAPSIPGLGTTGGFEFWVQNRGEGDYARLDQVTHDLIDKAKKDPVLSGLQATINSHSEQLYVDVDRAKAQSLGVPIESVYDAMEIFFGSMYVSQFSKYSRLWQVIVQAESQYRSTPTDIKNIYVKSDRGDMVPLSTLVTMHYTQGPTLVTRFNNFPAAKIMGNAAPGYSSGQAIAAMEQAAQQYLPSDFSYGWSGEAFEEKKTGSASSLVFVFGLIMVFLILAAQYESWSLPFGVLLAVPFAIFGAIISILMRGIEDDIYFQIGMLTLIALAAKNAILIFEFAVLKREEGLPPRQAALEAAKTRLRPILMTSIAFILGCVPLAIATGASSNSRHSIGTGVIGGMLGATVIAIFFIPLFFELLQRLSAWLGKKKLPDEPAQAGGQAQPAEEVDQ